MLCVDNFSFKPKTKRFAFIFSLVLTAIMAVVSAPAKAAVQLQQPYSAGPPYQPRAEQGNESGQVGLGYAYQELGQYEQAAEWYRRAAEQGNAAAQYKLAVLYHDGRGVLQDHATALKWFRKAAEQGDVPAQFAIGKAYLEGKGIDKNLVEAEKWLRTVAEMDEREAMPLLAELYAQGEGGIKKDYAQAYFWHLLASTRGNASLGDEIAAVKKNLSEQQIAEIETRANQWKPKKRPPFPGLAQSEARTARWWQQLAEKGDPEAQNVVGAIYRDGRGLQKDYAKAAAWFRKSADQGYVWGQINLGELYENGWGVKQDRAEAAAWYKRAVQHGINNGDSAGHGDAINGAYALGRLYAKGNDKSDYEEAYFWFVVSGSVMNRDDIAKHLTSEQIERIRSRLDHSGLQTALARIQAEPYATPHFYDPPCDQLQFSTPSEIISDLHLADLANSDRSRCFTPEQEPTFDRQFARAKQGNVSAQSYVGWLYYIGKGVTQNSGEALRWITAAAEKGLPDAQLSLGYLYINGRGVQHDYAKAYYWLKIAELKSGVRGQLEPPSMPAAKHLTASQIQELDKKVRNWSPVVDRVAAERGDAELQYWLGILYSRGWGVKQSDAEAARWWKRAAEQGNEYAQNELAISYSWGAGVVHDAEESVFWWLLSAHQTDTRPFDYLKKDTAEAIVRRVIAWKPHREQQ